MKYKEYKHKNYNLYTIKTDKFKTCHLEIIYHKNIKKEDITINNVLSDYLTYTSLDYPKRRDLVLHFEDLYDASFYNTVTRCGNVMLTNFIMDFLDPVYCDKDYLSEAIELPFKMLSNPLFKDTKNSLNTLNIVKSNIKASILSLKDQSTKYAFKRALNTLSPEGPFYQMSGYLEDLEKIDLESLEKYYNDFFNDNVCDIYIIGNLNMDNIDKLIEKYYLFKSNKDGKQKFFANVDIPKKIIEKEEMGNYEQSSLILILDASKFNNKEKTYVSHYFNTIFGNGALTNKLSKYLREENGLCYTTYSMYNKLDNLFLIYAGIDYENKDKCVSLIKKALKEMQEGVFDEEEIQYTRNTLLNQLKTSYDIKESIVDNYVFHNYINTPLLKNLEENISNVSKEEIVSLANKLSIKTIYLLGGTLCKK